MSIDEIRASILNKYSGICDIKINRGYMILYIIFEPDRDRSDQNEIRDFVYDQESNYGVSFEIRQLEPEEVLDMVLEAECFESIMVKLLNYKDQSNYSVNMSDGELDINIYNLKLTSEIYAKIKPKRKKYSFNLYDKTSLNIEKRGYDD